MAVQAQARPMPRWEIQKPSSGNIFSQIISLFTRPRAFFQTMPRSRTWLFVAMLILFIAGFSAYSQITQGQSTAASTTTQTTTFSVNSLQGGSSASSAQATPAAGSTQSTTSATQQTTAVDTNTTLMSALLAASDVIAMWAGQAVLLCLVSMLGGKWPNAGQCLQIAVWASLPLALMLVLRQASFAMGGTGGSVGLTLLLTQWNGYANLPAMVQRIAAVFFSNLSLFWLWDLALLYIGARYALGGRRLAVMFVTLMWVINAAVVPALVSTPVTTTAPRTSATVSTTQKSTTTSTSSTTTNQAQPGMDGGFPGGAPPSGAPPMSSASGTSK